MDYRDVLLLIFEWVQNLFEQMIMEEKVGQLIQLMGWKIYWKELDGIV